MKILVIFTFLWIYSLSAFGTTAKSIFAEGKMTESAAKYAAKWTSDKSAPTPLESNDNDEAEADDDASSEEIGDEEWAPALYLHLWSSRIQQVICTYKPLHLRHFSDRLFRPPAF